MSIGDHREWHAGAASQSFSQEGPCDLLFLGSQSPDLPPPHRLAPSETMVSDHGLGPPLSTEKPRNKGFSGSGAPIFGFGLADPATKG